MDDGGGDLNILTKSNLWDVSAINVKDLSFISKKLSLKIYDVVKN